MCLKLTGPIFDTKRWSGNDLEAWTDRTGIYLLTYLTSSCISDEVLACCKALLRWLGSLRTQRLLFLYSCLTCWTLLLPASASADGSASPTALSTKSSLLFSSPALPSCPFFCSLAACLLMADCSCSRCTGSAVARQED